MDQLTGILAAVLDGLKQCSFFMMDISRICNKCVKFLMKNILIFYIISGISCAPRMEEYQHGVIAKPMKFGIRNLTVVEIIPGNNKVNIDWKGYGTLTGNVFRIGYEKLVVSDSVTTFLVTDKGCGNNQLVVNGVRYSFDGDGQHLVIQLGVGIKVANGVNYAMARHVYEKNLFSIQ